ncbi:hypothetical protein NLO85_28540, partial [Pseudomonas savastanoi]
MDSRIISLLRSPVCVHTTATACIIYKGFPIEHKPNSFCLTPLHMPDRRKKVKDCGTTNGHLELIAR